MQVLKNWAGNLEYHSAAVDEPANELELAALIKKADKIKVLGTRHCFNDIADSEHGFISMAAMNRVVLLDEDRRVLTIEGGMNYGQLCSWLDGRGYALPNLASLPHISVAGACQTATHGSGTKNGGLATAVQSIRLVKANGEAVMIDRNEDANLFKATVVGLGGFGAISQITLNLVPRYEMRQYVFESLSVPYLLDHFAEIMSAAYSVSLFTTWQHPVINSVWIKAKADEKQPSVDNDFFGARPAKDHLHPIPGIPAVHCTSQMGISGPWFERLPHFKMGFTPSSGEELQTEYFVPAEHAVEAVQAISRLSAIIHPQLLVSEIRAIAADEFWMSPCRQQDSIAFHFTWKQNWPVVKQLLPQIEEVLAPFHARPHWGKLFTMTEQRIGEMYEMLPAFRELMLEFDPTGKFRNSFLEEYVVNGSREGAK